jgi:hypothetical protein
MLCLFGCIILQIEWGQVMEQTCIDCMSLHTFPIARHPRISPLLQFHYVGCEALRFQVFGREARLNRQLIFFRICLILCLSIHDYFLLYEPNDGSIMLGLCVFLIILTV